VSSQVNKSQTLLLLVITAVVHDRHENVVPRKYVCSFEEKCVFHITCIKLTALLNAFLCLKHTLTQTQ